MMTNWLGRSSPAFYPPMGHQCDEAKNARECKEALNRATYDVVFLDLVMPDRDGACTLPEIKQHDPDAHVVMISGSDDDLIIDQLLKKGASAYLLKPIYPDQLKALIEEIEADQLTVQD